MTESPGPSHSGRDDPDTLLEPHTDPGATAFGAMGTEAGSDLNWFFLLRQRVQHRAATSSRYEWWVLWSLLAGLLALNFTFTVFNVVLLKVAGQFHTSIIVLSWTITGPLLAYGLAAPVFGKIGDIFGHRRLYLFGLAGAMVSAVLTALAPGTALLIFARCLDGIQGAATGTASGALLNLVFRPEDRVKAMGWWSLVGAGGPVLGLSLGSPVIEAFGWRALFWIQLVLLAVAFLVVTLLLPHMRGNPADEAEKRARARENFRKMDWIGSWTLSLSVTSLLLGFSLGAVIGFASPACLTLFGISPLMAVGFIYRIRHAENPLIPVRYFRRRNFVMPMAMRAAANFAYFGGFILTPLLLEQAYHHNVAGAGTISVARPIAFAICSPIAGYVAIRVGERVSTVAGAFFLTGSMIVFALLQPHSSVVMVVLALALSGVGMGVAMPSSSSTMSNAVDPNEFGVMFAAQLLAMQVGEVAGIEVLLTLQATYVKHRGLTNSHSGAALLSTFRVPFVICAAAGALATVFSLFFRSFPRGQLRSERAEALDHSL